MVFLNLMENPLIYSSKEWTKYTKERFLRNIKIWNVIKTHYLEKSIFSTFKVNGHEIEITFSFKTYGRFVDMGAKGRKPKKWFAKLIYGRISQLRNIATAKMKETSLNIFR